MAPSDRPPFALGLVMQGGWSLVLFRRGGAGGFGWCEQQSLPPALAAARAVTCMGTRRVRGLEHLQPLSSPKLTPEAMNAMGAIRAPSRPIKRSCRDLNSGYQIQSLMS